MGIALVLALTLIFLTALILHKILTAIPAKELRRQARLQKNPRIESLFRLSAYGRSAELLLWLAGASSLSILLFLAYKNNWWVGISVALVAFWLAQMTRPRYKTAGWLWRIATWSAPLFLPIVSILLPLLSRLGTKSKPSQATLYEKEDLTEFLKSQARQPDNRISQTELKLAHFALNFSDKTVGQIMTPRRKIKWVAGGDAIGPMVMDELHKSGQTRFPVVKEVSKSANPEIIGVLYLTDLLDNLDAKGRVRDIMHSGVNFVNETQSLRAAVDGFLKSGQLLLVVVNNFEEIVGVIGMEDVLGQVFGEKISEDFENYSGSHFVAKQTDGQETEAKVE